MESSSYEGSGLVHVMLLKLSSDSLFLWQILAAWMSMKCLYFADKKIKGCGNCCPLTCRWDLGRVSFVSAGRVWDLQVCFAACSTIHLWAACSWQHEVFHNGGAHIFTHRRCPWCWKIDYMATWHACFPEQFLFGRWVPSSRRLPYWTVP